MLTSTGCGHTYFVFHRQGEAIPEVNWELTSCEHRSWGPAACLCLGSRKRKVVVQKVAFNFHIAKAHKSEYFQNCEAIKNQPWLFIFPIWVNRMTDI